MSDNISASVDPFVDGIDDELMMEESQLDSDGGITPVMDSRRLLEARLAERALARDVQEFDFDIE